MKISSYYVPCDPNEHFQAWEHDIGKGLPNKIAVLSKGGIDFKQIKSSSYSIMDFSDIAYCQLFSVPEDRPAKFIYTFLSDYINNESKCADWIRRVKPDLFCCLQHLPDELKKIGEEFNCEVKLIPWFVDSRGESEEKTTLGMCSGCVNPSIYPSRSRIYNYLKNLNINGVVLSGSTHFGSYSLSNEEYARMIKKTRYYFSGGIYDRFVPPKYYEVAKYGACIITFDMEYLKRVGFEHMKTCIVIKNLEEIPKIVSSDLYKEIGQNARKMILERHTTEVRAREILNVFFNKQNNINGYGTSG